MDEKTIARFWSKVDKNGPVMSAELGPCWDWIAALRGKGYGAFRMPGPQRHVEDAHRFAWMLAHGAPAGSKQVCHKCDRPRCCNPAHLFLGTNRERLAGQSGPVARPPALRPAPTAVPARPCGRA